MELDDAMPNWAGIAWQMSGGDALTAYNILKEVPIHLLLLWNGQRAYENSFKPDVK